MKKTISTLLILILGTTHSFAQNIKGRVLDKETNSAIKNANIYSPAYKEGSSTDSLGNFTYKSNYNKKSKLIISCLGYDSKEINFKDFKENTTIYLSKSYLVLDELILVQSTGKKLKENSLQIVTKPLSELKLGSSTIEDALTNISGVDNSSTGNSIGKPVIRGLQGNRIISYSQGLRVENQQWGGEHGLGISNLGIENLEVIKGPGSILYGSDAIGGVIYFTEERYAPINTTEKEFKSTLNSNTLGLDSELKFKMNKKNVKWNIFGGHSSHLDYKTGDNKFVENTRYNKKAIKSAIGLNGDNWTSNLRYSYLESTLGLPEGNILNSREKVRTPELPHQKIKNHFITTDNTIYLNESTIDIKLGFSSNNRNEFEDHEGHDDHLFKKSSDEHDHDDHVEEEPALSMRLNTFLYNTKWISKMYKNKFQFTTGFQGMYQTNKNNGEELLIPNSSTNDIGIFFLSEMHFKNLLYKVGIRQDFRKINSEAMSNEETDFKAFDKTFKNTNFTTGLIYAKHKSKWSANMASGFRSPNTAELLSNGNHNGENRYEIGNSNLKTEQAIQLDINYSFSDKHVDFTINPFYNRIKNYIYLKPNNEKIDDQKVYTYNQTDAKIYGGEFGVLYHPHNFHWLHIENNLSTVFAEDDNKNNLPLIPQIKNNLILKFHLKNTIFNNLFLQYVQKLKQTRISSFETPTEAYALFNLGGKLNISKGKLPISANLAINNIFNTEYIDHLSRLKTSEILNPGRNITLGIKISL